ncbi:parallel beta-helix repeat protein [Paraburkholderia sp. MM5496-R1]|uniref:Parallel beta-helix repeat (Two copies) n=1 Tax=Paraburkholderia tuberum TaxID=157910 RepID=A0A1H1JTU8_9BURK|nr:RICIN domain-containing protein [Paraburkholderia tuberum]SDR53055.1 parallel beta-helix repeat (two copies) [Paraburkholderia tuberum]
MKSKRWSISLVTSLALSALLPTQGAHALDATVQPGQSIQSALQSVAAAGGGTVTLGAGVWTLSSSIQIPGSNITLTGQGAATVIQGPSTPYVWNLILVNGQRSLHDITISNLVLDGQVPKSAAFDPNNAYSVAGGGLNEAAKGLELVDASNLKILNVEVRNTAEGMATGSINGLTIDRSYFHDSGIMVHGNDGLAWHNAYLWGSTNVTITNSRFLNSWAGDGLHINGPGSNAITVDNSTFVGNYRLGIHAQQTPANLTVSNNDLSFNGSTAPGTANYNGLSMSGLDMESTTGTIVGNTAIGNTNEGIITRSGTGTLAGNTALANSWWQIDNFGSYTVGANYSVQGHGSARGVGPIPDGTYQIVSRSSGLALAPAGQANGSLLTQTPYTRSTSQLWSFVNLGNGEYEVAAASSSLAMDVSGAGTGDGAQVLVWNYHGAANQIWRVISTGSQYYRLCPAHAPGSCLDVKGGSTASGANADLWQYEGLQSQQWQVLAP